MLRRLLAPLERRGRARARALLGGREPVLEDSFANGFGVLSRGATQARGNGCLAASHDRLVFCLWAPRRDLVVERNRIVAVGVTRAHLGKTVGRKLLHVLWVREDGAEDAAAWLVGDLDDWLAVLDPGPAAAAAQAASAQTAFPPP